MSSENETRRRTFQSGCLPNCISVVSEQLEMDSTSPTQIPQAKMTELVSAGAIRRGGSCFYFPWELDPTECIPG